MNQEQNNLNPNNLNTQSTNEIPNNPLLQDNQSLNNTFNQDVNQTTWNSQPQVNTNYQQTTNQENIQEPTPQPTNTLENGKASQNFNSKPPKKMNLGFMIGIVVAVAVIGVGAVLGSKLFLNTDRNNSTENNVSDNTSNDTSSSTNNNTSESGMQNNRKSISDYTWKDFVISIDNNIIAMGNPVNSIEPYGFSSKSTNYDMVLEKGQSVNTSMKYKNKGKDGNDIVFIPQVYNAHDTSKPVKETEMSGFEIDINFIKNIDVRLPGGLLLTENTTIEEIVDSMGNYSKNIAGGYYWEDEKSSDVYVHFGMDGKLFSVQYSYNVSLNI